MIAVEAALSGDLGRRGILDKSPSLNVRRSKVHDESRTLGLDRNELGALHVQAGLGDLRDGALITLRRTVYDPPVVPMGSSRHAVISCLVALLSLAACGGSSDDTATEDDSEASGGETADGRAEAAPDVDSSEYADVASIDRRPAMLSELGAPDAFVITVDEIDGVISVFESWTYYEARTQIDLVDGELLWDMEIEPLPEGSWLAITFSPTEFTMLASLDETMAALGDVALTQIDATDTEVAGAELWAGEQLLLGFVDDALVYVETFAAAPVDPEVVP